MTTAAEAAGAKTQLAGDLAAGVETLSLNQQITFTKYVRLVLPLDGFVFWVRADLVSPSALYNVARINGSRYNAAPKEPAAVTVNVQGSLHYATQQQQNEDETIAVNTVVFTALSEIQEFNEVGPSLIYIAEFDGIRFAFSQRRSFYKQAQLYHYAGDAIYPAMQTQIVDSIAGFSGRQVVSNSLPLWLALNSYTSIFGILPGLTLYPSFAVPDNLRPPYASVHIPPDTTTAIQGAPRLGRTLSHSQLVRETAHITLYGARNAEALTFQDAVNQYSLDTDAIGIMNMPAFRDQKRQQTELAILAMKKTIDFEINYYQSTARNVARQLILSAVPTYIVDAAA